MEKKGGEGKGRRKAGSLIILKKILGKQRGGRDTHGSGRVPSSCIKPVLSGMNTYRQCFANGGRFVFRIRISSHPNLICDSQPT